VGNGTDALELILAGLGIGAGDEVIVPTNTFVATAEAVVTAGARPRFVDVLPDTLLIDPDAVAAAVGPRTAAVLTVHLFGQMADMTALSAVTARHGLVLVEDAAQAHGARFAGRRAGSWGAAGAFSFYPGKNLGALGDGGAVVSDDPDLIDRIRRLADHGRSDTDRYVHELVGRNSRLDTLQAAVLSAKLEFLSEWSEARRRHAAYYDAAFRGVPEIRTPAIDEANESIYNQYTIRTDRRDALQAHLKAREIGTAIYYPIPLHLQQCFAYLGYKPGAFPESERAAKEVLSLPVYPELTEGQLGEVVEAVREFYGY